MSPATISSDEYGAADGSDGGGAAIGDDAVVVVHRHCVG